MHTRFTSTIHLIKTSFMELFMFIRIYGRNMYKLLNIIIKGKKYQLMISMWQIRNHHFRLDSARGNLKLQLAFPKDP